MWPQRYNDKCPECGEEFNLGDKILVDDDDTVHHYACYRGKKSPFQEQIET